MGMKMQQKAWLLAAAIVLTALTLRAAVTVVPPLVSTINNDLPLSAATIGILGMLPTAAFGLFGFLTPYVIRWASLEKLIVVAILVGIVGQIARVLSPTTPLFLVFSVVAFGGLGAGNVLLPPLVKKYFMHGTSHHLGLDVHDVSPLHEPFDDGMVFTIEPMLTLGTTEWDLWEDDWTVTTKDKSITAQFEHTIVVRENGTEILTLSEKDNI